MKKLYAFLLVGLVSVTVAMGQVRIFEIYGGGGNASAPFTNDYVLLFNYGSAPVSLVGYTLQYASATGAFTTAATLYR